MVAREAASCPRAERGQKLEGHAVPASEEVSCGSESGGDPEKAKSVSARCQARESETQPEPLADTNIVTGGVQANGGRGSDYVVNFIGGRGGCFQCVMLGM